MPSLTAQQWLFVKSNQAKCLAFGRAACCDRQQRHNHFIPHSIYVDGKCMHIYLYRYIFFVLSGSVVAFLVLLVKEMAA